MSCGLRGFNFPLLFKSRLILETRALISPLAVCAVFESSILFMISATSFMASIIPKSISKYASNSSLTVPLFLARSSSKNRSFSSLKKSFKLSKYAVLRSIDASLSMIGLARSNSFFSTCLQALVNLPPASRSIYAATLGSIVFSYSIN